MNHTETVLEFDQILKKLADCAQSDHTAERIRSLKPYLDERKCRAQMLETTEARRILDALGNPPLASMKGLAHLFSLVEKESLLTAQQLTAIAQFLISCKRLKSYLKRSEYLFVSLSSWEGAISECDDLREEITETIQNEQIADSASAALKNIRRQSENISLQMKAKLESLLKAHKEWFSDAYVVNRNGYFVLPVKKEFRSQISGTVVDTSSTGATCFMEPSSVSRLREELTRLEIEEDAEIRRILYVLTAYVEENLALLRRNQETVEALDFAFAKAKLSQSMRASAPKLNTNHIVRLKQARHPLLSPDSCVPLDFIMGGDVQGIVITGPNTGGKTVALKTIGLLSIMAQCGLHIPASEDSELSLYNSIYCDIGDGQSISENLSTFSSHITNTIHILSSATADSLVLLDELGSGTDPAEGMGIAVAILSRLKEIGCLFIATTHYPEVKDYADQTEGLLNARMAFDRESLKPLYRLELGKAGESCALYIASRLGFPTELLEIAQKMAGSQTREAVVSFPAASSAALPAKSLHSEKLKRDQAKKGSSRAASFQMGDSVRVFPEKEMGIVYQGVDENGMIVVQVKGKKRRILYKRLQLVTPAAQLYPPNYDFSIIFDSVANRKANKKMLKGHQPNLTVTYDDPNHW